MTPASNTAVIGLSAMLHHGWLAYETGKLGWKQAHLLGSLQYICKRLKQFCTGLCLADAVKPEAVV